MNLWILHELVEISYEFMQLGLISWNFVWIVLNWLGLVSFFFYIISLCYVHYDGTIAHKVNNNIIYNSRKNVLLNANLGMSFVDMKQAICHELGWNYNGIEVDITRRCQVEEHQYYLYRLHMMIFLRQWLIFLFKMDWTWWYFLSSN